MPETLSNVVEIANWLREVWNWFTSPSVLPWIGLLAAIGAAVTIDMKQGGNSRVAIQRLARVTLVWLGIVILLNSLLAFVPDDGPNGGGTTDEEVDEDDDEPELPPKVVTRKVGVPDDIDILLNFVYSDANDERLVQFACDITSRQKDNSLKHIEIRADNFKEFDVLLQAQLRNISTAYRTTGATVRINANPYPGKSVINRITGLIKNVLKNSLIEIKKGSE